MPFFELKISLLASRMLRQAPEANAKQDTELRLQAAPNAKL
jgi:hypothetical protein